MSKIEENIKMKCKTQYDIYFIKSSSKILFFELLVFQPNTTRKMSESDV